MQTLTLAYLAFGATFYLALGVAGLLAPTWLLSLVGISLDTPSALNEVRAFFGGQSLVLGALFALGAARERWRRPAVGLFVALAAAFALSRGLSLAVDGTPGIVNWILFGMELLGVASGALLLRLGRSR